MFSFCFARSFIYFTIISLGIQTPLKATQNLTGEDIQSQRTQQIRVLLNENYTGEEVIKFLEEKTQIIELEGGLTTEEHRLIAEAIGRNVWTFLNRDSYLDDFSDFWLSQECRRDNPKNRNQQIIAETMLALVAHHTDAGEDHPCFQNQSDASKSLMNEARSFVDLVRTPIASTFKNIFKQKKQEAEERVPHILRQLKDIVHRIQSQSSEQKHSTYQNYGGNLGNDFFQTYRNYILMPTYIAYLREIKEMNQKANFTPFGFFSFFRATEKILGEERGYMAITANSEDKDKFGVLFCDYNIFRSGIYDPLRETAYTDWYHLMKPEAISRIFKAFYAIKDQDPINKMTDEEVKKVVEATKDTQFAFIGKKYNDIKKLGPSVDQTLWQTALKKDADVRVAKPVISIEEYAFTICRLKYNNTYLTNFHVYCPSVRSERVTEKDLQNLPISFVCEHKIPDPFRYDETHMCHDFQKSFLWGKGQDVELFSNSLADFSSQLSSSSTYKRGQASILEVHVEGLTKMHQESRIECGLKHWLRRKPLPLDIRILSAENREEVKADFKVGVTRVPVSPEVGKSLNKNRPLPPVPTAQKPVNVKILIQKFEKIT